MITSSEPPVNVAEEVIGWLRAERLKVGEQWSYPLPTGFSWWAAEHCQTVEILGEETGPNGESGYLVCVRTELLRDVDLTDAALDALNALPMRCASMSGPVYDADARMLDLWTLIRVTDDNGGWTRSLLAGAAVTQLAEAGTLAPVLASAIGAQSATSAHPVQGQRNSPAEVVVDFGAYVRAGDEPCAWPEAEFRDVLSRYGDLAVAVDAGRSGFTVEFPFGGQTSQCRVLGDQPHPLYGNGLLVVQSFPVDSGSALDGIRLALSLNAADLTSEPAGYGIGSYSYADGAMHFSGFVPNALHEPGLLPNLYLSAAARAQRMAVRFVEGGWDGDAYSLDAAVLARHRDKLRASMPAVEPPMRGCPMMRARAGGD